jgi:hypothetical protein
LIDSSKTLLEIDSSNFNYLILSRFSYSVYGDQISIDLTKPIFMCHPWLNFNPEIMTNNSRIISFVVLLISSKSCQQYLMPKRFSKISKQIYMEIKKTNHPLHRCRDDDSFERAYYYLD